MPSFKSGERGRHIAAIFSPGVFCVLVPAVFCYYYQARFFRGNKNKQGKKAMKKKALPR
jgi:hypothetical protein